MVSASIPSPSIKGFHLGPLFVHFYGLCYVVGITAAIAPTRRLWRARGGDPDLVYTVALWGVPAGIFGGRLYHDVTSLNEVPHNWWGWLAVWQGGLGIWGGIAGGFIGGVPWGLEISAAHRPAKYLAHSTFQPTFLYEMLWDLALAAALVWLIRRKTIRAPGIFALHVTGYSAFRIFEELLRVDPANYILGERPNFWVASLVTVVGLLWFVSTQRARSSRYSATGLERLKPGVRRSRP